MRRDPVQNVLAGFTVAIVALPLALAFGRTAFGDVYGPAAGLWSAIVAGFIAAMLGGSGYAITGPTGVLAIFTAGLVAQHGGFASVDGIAFGFLAVILSGLFQILLGAARIGRVAEFIPYPVITGFMMGIALIIVWTGVKDAINPGDVPLTDAEGWQTFGAFVAGASPEHVYVSVGLTGVAIAIAFGWPRAVQWMRNRKVILGRDGTVAFWVRQVPGSLWALLVVTILALVAPHASELARLKPLPGGGPVPFTDFGLLARHPDWWGDLVVGAFGLALISSIDTLLTCVVADGVVGGRTRSNRELVAQGIANASAGLLSASQACGAAVRTMVNVKNGGRTRLSGMSHAVVLAILVFAGAALVTYVPVAALAGILVVTGIGMVEWHAIATSYKAPLSDTLVMLATALLTVWVGLVEAVLAGVVLAALLFAKRMAQLADFVSEGKVPETHPKWRPFHEDVIVYDVRGPLFFGAAGRFAQAMDRARLRGRVVVFRMHAVTTADVTGMRAFDLVAERLTKLGIGLLVVGLPQDTFEKFERFGLVQRIGRENFHSTTEAALASTLIGTSR